MLNTLITVAAFIVAISVLVVVHEFGHYWVARRLGIKVLRFSVGFGRPLWSRRYGRDQTEWTIAAIPLGGYVKMLDEHDGDVRKEELPRAFNRQPIWSRTLVVLAGPFFNFLFAVLAYSFINMLGAEGIRPVVGRVVDGSLAQQAGFRSGDELIAIDGRAVQSWDQRRLYLYERALDRATVRIDVRSAEGIRQERLLDLASITAADVGAGLLEREIGMSPAMPELLAILGAVEAGGPAARAGLQAGDRIVAINGRAVRLWQEAVADISNRPDESLRITVDRNGVTREFVVQTLAADAAGQRIGRIGVGVQIPVLPPEYLVQVRHSPFSAVGESIQTTWHLSVLTLKMLWKMVQLEVSTKTISGPITIAQYAGASAQMGIERFVLFLAVVSISLGVLNLLPIPVLDGGHLLYFALEGLKGRPLSDQTLFWGQQIGIVMLVALMSLAFYNDFMRLLS